MRASGSGRRRHVPAEVAVPRAARRLGGARVTIGLGDVPLEEVAAALATATHVSVRIGPGVDGIRTPRSG